MNDFFNCIISTHGIAYLTGGLIFLITLLLAAKRVIGWGVAFLFLLFALLAAQSISNQDLIRQYFKNFSPQTPSSSYQAENAPQNEKTDINAELQKAFDDLKAEFLIEKEKLQKLYDELNSQKTEKKDKKEASSANSTDKTKKSQP
jgi:uncharacterized protein (DUF58 family)